MARQDANAALAATSFLYGANAPYIEELHARYDARPERGRRGLACLLRRASRTSPTAILAEANGPSWRRRDWPPVVNGELVSALDGNWADVAAETADKIKAGRPGPRRRDHRKARSSRRRAIRSAPS